MSLFGPKLPNRDVRYLVAVGGRPDMAQTVQFGRDWPDSDVGGSNCATLWSSCQSLTPCSSS